MLNILLGLLIMEIDKVGFKNSIRSLIVFHIIMLDADSGSVDSVVLDAVDSAVVCDSTE